MSQNDIELPEALEIPARGWLRGLFDRSAPDLAAQMDTGVAAIRSSRRPEYVAVFGGKGGAGKTTTSTGLGSMLAGVMRDRVAVVDSNPDKGTLRLKFPTGQAALPLQQLAGRTEQLRSYSDLRPYLPSNELGIDALTSTRHRDSAPRPGRRRRGVRRDPRLPHRRLARRRHRLRHQRNLGRSPRGPGSRHAAGGRDAGADRRVLRAAGDAR
ncbi:MAG: hypothetical protein EOP24_41300 [Hyphomicrobiales bacterium]|nr:MAG: hypothetical protein EOP24_41300 [Hyphomicrobiales bacterium]